MPSPSDDTKNDFVVALEEIWSPHESHQQPNSGSDCVHESSLTSNGSHSHNFVEPVLHDTDSFKIQDLDGTLVMDDTVKSMDFMVTQEQLNEAVFPSDSSADYEQIEALVYGMNRFMIDHDQAVALARKYPKDPAMMAVQALLEKHSVTSQKLWNEAKELGLLSKAKQGHGFAKAMAGRMLECTVTGVHYLAESWYEPAAEQGQATAQYFLAKSLEDTQDFETAFSWYLMAAEQGHASAQVRLGRIFRKGLVSGETCPLDKARSWFEKAAVQGDGEGRLNLAFVFYKEQDPNFPVYWHGRVNGGGNKESLSRCTGTNLGDSGTKGGRKRDGDSDSEKYWIGKAQKNLGQLFVPDQEESTVPRIDETETNQSKKEGKPSCSGLFLKMHLAGLEWASSESNKDNAATLTSIATWNSQRRRSATATLTSIMSIQTLSIGSKDALSIASIDSFRQAASSFRFESDEESKSSCEDGGNAWGRKEAALNGTYCEDFKESLIDSEEMDVAMDLEETSGSVQEFLVNSDPDVIKPYFAIMGDKTARGPRLTVGAKELRNTKEWYRENRAAYQRRGCQSELFPDAMARYYQKMSELFVGFPKDHSAREKTFLMYCSKKALTSGRVDNPNCFRHANDKEFQYGTAKFPEAVLFYFNSRDPPKLENVVARYRDILSCRPGLSGGEREYFERYLDFCEMTLEKASNGCATAQLAMERNNFIPTLKSLWEDIEKGNKNRGVL
eukprot:scaffold2043_cov166-Amphora_coffeaeformis.AAC.24